MNRAIGYQLLLLSLCLLQNSVSAQNWQPLFDGHSFDGWTQQNGNVVDTPGWETVDGMLHLNRKNGKGGNLLSQEIYGDFELVFDWKLAKGANNGIKYRVNKFDGRFLGIEYQLIDDLNKPSLKPRYRTASLYDIYEPAEHQLLRPPGEFNSSHIAVRRQRIEHWLNGHLVTEAIVGSAEWQERIAKSKFSDVVGFGVIPTGHIMITDHGDEAWYRNIFIRRLDAESQEVAMNVSPTATCTSQQPQQCVQTRRWMSRRWIKRR